MSERPLPPSTSWAGRNILNFVWRVLAFPRMAAVLLSLLAIAAVLTLVFSPQRPQPSADAAALVQWTNKAQERFGQWYDTLSAVGVFDVGSAVWLRGLLALSALSLLVGLADRAAQVVRAWQQADVRRTESFFRAAAGAGEWRVSQERVALVEDVAQRLAWPVWLPWKRWRICPRREEAGGASYLHQDWLTWRRAASLLVHVGLLLVLAGVALDTRLGWRQEGVMLVPGQPVALDRQPDLSLRLERVEGSGATQQAASQVALADSAGASLTGAVAVGQPYTAHGLTIYQRDVGPMLRVSARGGDGVSGGTALIPLVDASAEMEPADEVRLVFTESRVEHYVLMPYIQKAVRLVLYRHGERWDVGRDELQVTVYAGSSETPAAEGTIVGSGPMRLEDIVYDFIWEQYAVLDVVRSSCQWLIRVGMGLALLGLAMTLLLPPVRLWVRVVEEGEACVVGLAGEMPGAELLADWLANWRRRLGGGDADG